MYGHVYALNGGPAGITVNRPWKATASPPMSKPRRSRAVMDILPYIEAVRCSVALYRSYVSNVAWRKS